LAGACQSIVFQLVELLRFALKRVRKIELLAPAKNLETALAAIEHGADAVYIGAPKFGARAAAGNSIEDIWRLTDYAHRFHVRIYVTLNTILTDAELPEAEAMIWQLYRAGADALIIQDMGILQMALPPMALHASTQTDNRSLEKVSFLAKAGFARVVLARELSLREIGEIARQVSVDLEVFVHGALCTSFSGQCFISQALAGRSANRGECAQFCRLPYSLTDATGKTMVSDKHLLSLKDLNLSASLEQLLDAGVSSLKIEGRLKDTAYVKNVTAYYRQCLDKIFSRRPEYRAASSGETTHFFLPNLEKSFNRGFTDYFFQNRHREMAAHDSPKSIGEFVGSLSDIQGKYFTVAGNKPIHNGDGLCFMTDKGLVGFRVNRVEGRKIFPAEQLRLDKGLMLYRNYDHEFERTLAKSSAERKIGLQWQLAENNFGFSLTATDADGYSVTVTSVFEKERAKHNQAQNIQEQLAKLGATIFRMTGCANRLSDNYFLPSSLLGEMRRRAIERLMQVRNIALPRPLRAAQPSDHLYPADNLDFTANVANRYAQEFYRRHGVQTIAPAMELKMPDAETLMFTKYCLRYQLGACPKQKTAKTLNEPLRLTTAKHRLQLHFDCSRCEMQVKLSD
jgi:putative protease